jgi:hypothetical protein
VTAVFSSSRRRRHFEPNTDEHRERQIEQVHALLYALLLDTVAWFLDLRQPVDEHLFPEYRLGSVAALADPRDRLNAYCNPRLLAAWEPVRRRWRGRDIRMKPDFGTTATLRIEGLDGGGTPCAVARFTDRSVLEQDSRRQYNSNEWVLTAWLRPDLEQIENATFRAANDGDVAP